MTAIVLEGRTGNPLRWFSARLVSVALLVSATLTAATAAVHAQSTNFGAGFLLQPVGARTVGHGEATAADTTLGTEALWWNPAGMARMRKREFGVHHAQTFLANTDMLAFAYPSKALGTIAASVLLVNYGDIEATDSTGNAIGLSTNRYYVLSAGYATPVGKHFSAGLTGKKILLRFICSGCLVSQPNRIGNAYALDLGAQYILPLKAPITIGASVRNLGEKLQAKDEAQADPLPSIIQIGAQGQVPLAALAKSMTTLDLRADLLTSPAYSSPSLRVGADLSYKNQYTLRVGYKQVGQNDGVESGLTAGFGFKYNSVEFDVARRFDASSSIGEATAPTYISLRYVF
ncbi:MAG: PorV/PorQ family protein [Gemmatimonas sp.]